jgi:hypothetical protein
VIGERRVRCTTSASHNDDDQTRFEVREYPVPPAHGTTIIEDALVAIVRC